MHTKHVFLDRDIDAPSPLTFRGWKGISPLLVVPAVLVTDYDVFSIFGSLSFFFILDFVSGLVPKNSVCQKFVRKNVTTK